jgi:bacillithiol synthase
MLLEKIDCKKLDSIFSPLLIDYLHEKEHLKPFYNLFPNPKNIAEQIKQKAFTADQRSLLHHVLAKQYAEVEQTGAVGSNLELLTRKNTFTVTTGHQLNIFSGPLYFIYKIVATINACKQLEKAHPDYHFVPVYWMASEDHDFEEISQFTLFGKTYTWHTGQQGAVGRMNPNGIQQVLKELPEKVHLFEEAYTNHSTLAAATRYFVNELFGRDGLLVIDGDDKELKRSFQSVIKDDLVNHRANALVEEQSTKLNELGYKTQVFPRNINFFYLDDHGRNRIVKEEGIFRVLNRDLQFTTAELPNKLETCPECFSPNVVMRPLYQETVLPNLAYIGGPAEVAYWMQLKPVFEHYQVPFPMVMPRSFGLIIPSGQAAKLRKLTITTEELFMDTRQLVRYFVEKNSEHTLKLDEERELLRDIFKSIHHKAVSVDGSLDGLVKAEHTRSTKIVNRIEKRLRKAEEQRQEIEVGQIEKLREKLFPGDSLQERKENFLNFYIPNPEIINEMLQAFNPFEYSFNVLIED